jgi:hypothetical protein
VKLNVAKESARRKKGCNSLETTKIKEYPVIKFIINLLSVFRAYIY